VAPYLSVSGKGNGRMSTPPSSLKSFLTGLIDYAGLFPPAELPLIEAIEHYRRYRLDADAWMLSRFIIPVSQLAALTEHIDVSGNNYFDTGTAYSLLGQDGQNGPAFLKGIEQDIHTVKQFRRSHGTQAVLDIFEVRLPASDQAIHDVICQASHLLLAGGLRPFFEVPEGADWQPSANVAITAIGAYNRAQPSAPIGFKLRCGGVVATAFPSPKRVAAAIVMCREATVPLKATAGLHHPIRHYNDSVQTRMHGFVNFFGAGILAHVHGLGPQDIQTILEDEDADHFTFSDQMFTWQHLSATVEDIVSMRAQALISYGSCSFDEPREDLSVLGWL